MVKAIASKILLALSEKFILNLEPYFISVSIGIAMITHDTDDVRAETLLINADQAMYAAKKEGRNRFRFYENSMQNQMQKRMNIAKASRAASQAK
jgi:diguanylate cyclase (GGDEF)-like protein